ncbi:symmetrical bis(5'-nucleosyl)-tetraphosphatase [Malikia granosa]|uniref:bis(5'-nucleosyl)-tetraphosphatase (symmetrical) n=1 Tax=Malikia granosa TaxID=263067 RepID=A0A2S9K2Z2_9BURK|nr:symmetrical bis(5'-nucleosyl)-tetraphosphatase [Malikia granosa]PRD64754.1 bis(5'-nucleosyl)-tetraphosphatase (symmetrical) [Malikia granosa]
MALYLIGDLQGCDEALQRLLHTLDFSPSRDTLYLLGDLVNRGPASLAVLRRLMGYGESAQCLLGNHDLHLLAVAAGVRRAHRSDTLDEILAAPDRAELLHWVRARPLALQVEGWLLVHAGLLPQWTAQQALALAQEFSAMLSGSEGPDWLQRMYGNQPDRWSDGLAGDERWRVVVNAMTRLRFCDAAGRMDFDSKEGAGSAPAGYLPWFEVPGRRSADTPIAFGHWSTLGLLQRDRLLALDTGCLWGGCLSAARLQPQPEGPAKVAEIIQVDCPQTRQPGV